jgi:hypothetical protein
MGLGALMVRRIRQMPAPNQAWRELATAYADIYEDMLGAIERIDPVPIQDINRRRAAADARLLLLRSRYSDHPQIARGRPPLALDEGPEPPKTD